eukprot:3046397-Alexandrium_andersonii.AAC.2
MSGFHQSAVAGSHVAVRNFPEASSFGMPSLTSDARDVQNSKNWPESRVAATNSPAASGLLPGVALRDPSWANAFEACADRATRSTALRTTDAYGTISKLDIST